MPPSRLLTLHQAHTQSSISPFVTKRGKSALLPFLSLLLPHTNFPFPPICWANPTTPLGPLPNDPPNAFSLLPTNPAPKPWCDGGWFGWRCGEHTLRTRVCRGDRRGADPGHALMTRVCCGGIHGVQTHGAHAKDTREQQRVGAHARRGADTRRGTESSVSHACVCTAMVHTGCCTHV